MFDFNNIMTSLGFEAEPIMSAFNVCYAMIEEVRNFALELGNENDADALCFDFDGNYPDDAFAEAVQTRFIDDIWRGKPKSDSLTAQIVLNCYNTTFEILEDTELFKELNVFFYGEKPLVLECSEKIYKLGDIESLDTDCGEKICTALKEALVDRLYGVINKCVDYSKEAVQTELNSGTYEWDDIVQCLQDGKVDGSIAKAISVRLVEQSKKGESYGLD